MAGSEHLSRRDFVNGYSGRGCVYHGCRWPAGHCLSDRAGAPTGGSKDAWIPLGKLDSFAVGKPTLSTFTRSKVNGWEKYRQQLRRVCAAQIRRPK